MYAEEQRKESQNGRGKSYHKGPKKNWPQAKLSSKFSKVKRSIGLTV